MSARWPQLGWLAVGLTDNAVRWHWCLATRHVGGVIGLLLSASFEAVGSEPRWFFLRLSKRLHPRLEQLKVNPGTRGTQLMRQVLVRGRARVQEVEDAIHELGLIWPCGWLLLASAASTCVARSARTAPPLRASAAAATSSSAPEFARATLAAFTASAFHAAVPSSKDALMNRSAA